MVNKKIGEPLTCNKCGFTWYRRLEKMPVHCANPHCKTRYWNTPKPKRGGWKLSPESRENMRKAKLGKKRPDITGELNPNWKGEAISLKGGRLRAWKMYPCPEGRERHHIDGNPKNNDPSNIELLTHKEHMIKDGRLEKWNVELKTRTRTFTAEGLRKKREFARLRPRSHGKFLPTDKATLVKKA